MKENDGLQSIGIYIFDDVELLDFAGPLQVFSAARYLDDVLIPVIDLVGPKPQITVAKSQMQVVVQKLLKDAGGYDLFLIPGGFGTRPILENTEELEHLKRISEASKFLASVCTGSLVLARLGMLKGLTATTHFGAIDLLRKIEPNLTVDRSRRYIDNGRIIISEGVSAGIDMSFHLLARFFSQELSDTVKRYIEYYPEKEGEVCS